MSLNKILMSRITTISVIIPIYNGSQWIDQCFESINQQIIPELTKIEICVCNDASTDDTANKLKTWKRKFEKNNILLKTFYNNTTQPKGVGYSKNKAISIASGSFLCFQDIDDIMLPNRILLQYKAAIELPRNTLIGCKFKRNPEGSTKRFTQWANFLSPSELKTQIYTSNGPTLIMPSWFCHRTVYDNTNGFSNAGEGTPEDLIFFYEHLNNGGELYRVDQYLIIYTYHMNSTTFSIHAETIWNLRIQRLENLVLENWTQFTIWNAGKQGRKLYKSLSLKNRQKVIQFCDVDIKKLGRQYIHFNEITRQNGTPIDIIHFTKAKPPFVICVKMKLTNGDFETNLDSLKLEEGVDYIWFS